MSDVPIRLDAGDMSVVEQRHLKLLETCAATSPAAAASLFTLSSTADGDTVHTGVLAGLVGLGLCSSRDHRGRR